MNRLLLIPLLALTACASSPRTVDVTIAPPIPVERKLRDIIPASQLRCLGKPDGSKVTSARQSAKYIVDLDKAGADCRQKLSVVRDLVTNQE